MRDKKKFLRHTIVGWVLIPLLCTLVLSSFSSYYLALNFANSAFDLELEENARTLAGQVTLDDGKWMLASPALSEFVFRHHNKDRDEVFFLITDASGHFIGGDKELGKPGPLSGFSSFTNKKLKGKPLRVVTLKIPVKSNGQNSFILVQMAETLNERGILAKRVLFNTVAHQVVLALLAIFFVWMGVHRGLIPLERLRRDIKKTTPKDLSPLPETGLFEELKPVVLAINDLVQRLNAHIGLQQRFIANAAHQLRTPLAGMQTHIELLARQNIPDEAHHSLDQVEVSLERSTHMVHQLLSLSRAEPGGLKADQFTTLDLVALVQGITESFATIALNKNIDLSLSVPEQAVAVYGNAPSLREMVSNIIDNALQYTPEGGQVTVELIRQKEQAHLFIVDTGPGIAEEERPRVFERFYRIPGTPQFGSGLGLSIVDEIARAHNVAIRLQSGRDGLGTSVSLFFPLLV